MIKLLINAKDEFSKEMGDYNNIDNYYLVTDENPSHAKKDLVAILNKAVHSMNVTDIYTDSEKDFADGEKEYGKDFSEIYEYASSGVSKLEVFLRYLELNNIKYSAVGKPEADFVFEW